MTDTDMRPNIYILNVDGDIDMGGFCVLLMGPFGGPEDGEKYFRERVYYNGANEYISITATAAYISDLPIPEGWYLVLDISSIAPLNKVRPGKHWKKKWLCRVFDFRPEK